jgi:hypothetical protein
MDDLFPFWILMKKRMRYPMRMLPNTYKVGKAHFTKACGQWFIKCCYFFVVVLGVSYVFVHLVLFPCHIIIPFKRIK